MKIEILKEKVPNTTGHIINYQPCNYHLLLTDSEEDDELSSLGGGGEGGGPYSIALNKDGGELRRDWQKGLKFFRKNPIDSGVAFLIEELVHHYWTQCDDTHLIQELEYRSIKITDVERVK